MEPLRLAARAEQRSLEEFEGALAERVTPTSLFLPQALFDAGDVPVGAWVRVEVALSSGELGLRLDGVVVWRYCEGAVPPGREAGVGVAIVAVDDACRARFGRMCERPGAGARVRVPAARLLQRQKLTASALARLPARVPSGPAVAPAVPASPFADPAEVPAVTDGRAAILAAHLGPSPDPGAAFLEAPTLDGFDEALAPPTQDAPPQAPSTSPTRLENIDAFPDAPLADTPFAEPHAPPFDPQSTDVDLLASVSAEDLISLELAHAGDVVALPSPAEQFLDLEDLPSVDAELVEHGRPAGRSASDGGAQPVPEGWSALELGETEVLRLRSVPMPEPWPPWSDLVDARAIGVFCSFGPRGQSPAEVFPWPAVGTKRFSRVDVIEQDDVEVFSSADAGDAFATSTSARDDPFADPFASRATDPRMSVEGVVARAVRAAHAAEADVDVFADGAPGDGSDAGAADDGDVTRDEMPLPALVTPVPDPTTASDLASPAEDPEDGDPV